MHILCTICSDIVSQSASLYVTKCGHLFHHHCLSQWIERSRTCPQCRNKVTATCMWRVYPTAAAAQGEDAAALQARLDDAQLAARQRDAALQAARDENKQANEKAQALQDQLKASETRLVRAESATSALREQLEYLRAQSKDAARLRADCELLKGKLATLQALQKVVEASAEEVETMLEGYSDARTIAVFATAFKRAVGTAEKARRGAESRLAAARASLAVERSRNNYLSAELGKLKELAATTPRRVLKRKSCDSQSSLSHKRDRLESRDTFSSTTMEPADTTATAAATASASANDVSLGTLVARIEASDSPYVALRHAPPALSLQPKLEGGGQRPSTSAASGVENKPWAANRSFTNNKFSIFHSKPPRAPLAYCSPSSSRDPELEPQYDGLGGRARPDHFPRPNPTVGKSFAPKLSAKHKLTRNPTTDKRINTKKK